MEENRSSSMTRIVGFGASDGAPEDDESTVPIVSVKLSNEVDDGTERPPLYMSKGKNGSSEFVGFRSMRGGGPDEPTLFLWRRPAEGEFRVEHVIADEPLGPSTL